MDREEKVMMQNMITLTTEVTKGMQKDHDIIILANQRTLDNKKSIATNRKWLWKLGGAVLVCLVYAEASAGIFLKMVRL